MNVYQRIVLIVGAIILIVSIWTCPKWIHYPDYVAITEINTAIARSIGVIGATLLVFLALKDIGKKEK